MMSLYGMTEEILSDSGDDASVYGITGRVMCGRVACHMPYAAHPIRGQRGAQPAIASALAEGGAQVKARSSLACALPRVSIRRPARRGPPVGPDARLHAAPPLFPIGASSCEKLPSWARASPA